MSSRKRYTQEFKREAVQMTNAAGVTARQVAHELGIHTNTIGRSVTSDAGPSYQLAARLGLTPRAEADRPSV